MYFLEHLPQMGEGCELRVNASRWYKGASGEDDWGECTTIPRRWTLQGCNSGRQTPAILWWDIQWSCEGVAHWDEPGMLLHVDIGFWLNYPISRFKLLSMLHSKRWCRLQLVRPVASNWNHESRTVRPLCKCSRSKWRDSRSDWMYVLTIILLTVIWYAMW